MKPVYFILALLAGMAAITFYILQAPVPAGATGLAHETIPAMKVGGDGMARLASVSGAVYYFQHIGIILYTAFLYLGISPRRRDRRLRVILGCFTLFSIIAWHQLFGTYEAFYSNGVTGRVFGIPVPTVWFLAGIWGSYLPYVVFYVVAFRQYFFTAEDEADFEALVAEIKAEKGDA